MKMTGVVNQKWVLIEDDRWFWVWGVAGSNRGGCGSWSLARAKVRGRGGWRWWEAEGGGCGSWSLEMMEVTLERKKREMYSSDWNFLGFSWDFFGFLWDFLDFHWIFGQFFSTIFF